MNKKSLAAALIIILLLCSLLPLSAMADTEYVYEDSVSKPHVTLYRVEGEEAHTIKITFNTNDGGALTGGSDQIILTLPSDFRMPTSISKDKITINGLAMTTTSPMIVEQRLFLTLSGAMNIPEKSPVVVVIAADSGITVNEEANDVTLTVVTTQDTRFIESYPFDVTESEDMPYLPADSNLPVVTVAPNGAGTAGGYTLTAKAYTYDTIDSGNIMGFTLTFPAGTILPGTIDPKNVTVNGQQSSGILVNPTRREIIFTLPVGVARSSDVIIKIAAAAGIKNPPAAQYVMDIMPLKGMVSVSTEGFEIKTTSDPATLIPAPAESIQKIVKLTLNSSIATKNGQAITLDVAATLINGFTMVPVRFVSDGLGAAVAYDSSMNTVTLTYGARVIVLWPGSTIAKVDNKPITLAKAPVIKDGRTLVPIRFVSECFGAKVDFVSVTAPITITVNSADMASLPTVEAIQASQVIASGGTASGSTGSGSMPSGTAATSVVGKTISLKTENSTANLRSGPGVTYSKVGLLLPSETASIMEVSGEWYHIKFDYGMEAWIKSDLVDVK